MILDLSNRAYVFQYLHVNVTETPIIPYSIDRYYVYGSNKAHLSLVGDVVGPIFPTMPVNATSLLNLPMVIFLILVLLDCHLILVYIN